MLQRADTRVRPGLGSVGVAADSGDGLQRCGVVSALTMSFLDRINWAIVATSLPLRSGRLLLFSRSLSGGSDHQAFKALQVTPECPALGRL